MSSRLWTLSSPSLTAALASSQTNTSGIAPSAQRVQRAGLLVFDLDGTIVQSGSYISGRVFEALREARRAGYVTAVCSGRPLCMIGNDLRSGKVMDYLVCSNGAAILDGCGNYLLRHPMSQDRALANIDLLRDLHASWNMFTGPHAYRERSGDSYMRARMGEVLKGSTSLSDRISKLRSSLHFMFGAHFTAVKSLVPLIGQADDGIEKMGCSVNPQVRDEAHRRLMATGELEVAIMGAGELEITLKGVTKGTGLNELGQRIAVPKEQRIAFGDGGNDLPMMEAVGRFVAMGNASEEVKRQATDHCDTIQNDGVATWIEHELL